MGQPACLEVWEHITCHVIPEPDYGWACYWEPVKRCILLLSCHFCHFLQLGSMPAYIPILFPSGQDFFLKGYLPLTLVISYLDFPRVLPFLVGFKFLTPYWIPFPSFSFQCINPLSHPFNSRVIFHSLFSICIWFPVCKMIGQNISIWICVFNLVSSPWTIVETKYFLTHITKSNFSHVVFFDQ